jgi:SurA N-terminal domain
VREVALIIAAATVVAVAAGCGGASREHAVAHVGTMNLTREQLEQTIEHFRNEARREGKPFATDAAAREQLLGLLVFRARLAQGAAKLGVTVPDELVERRIAASGGDEADDGDARAFVESSVRTQLLEEAVYKRLARRVHETDPQRAQAERNALLQAWLASLATRFPLR